MARRGVRRQADLCGGCGGDLLDQGPHGLAGDNRAEPGRKADPPVDLRIVPADQLENFLAELAAEKG